MNCPKCAGGPQLKEFIVRSGLHVDLCDSCHGVWLDRSEVYHFVKRPEDLHAEFARAFRSAALSGHRCPRCSDVLAAARIESAALVFEACPSCQGTWFDAAEVSALNEALERAGLARRADAPAQGPPGRLSASEVRDLLGRDQSAVITVALAACAAAAVGAVTLARGFSPWLAGAAAAAILLIHALLSYKRWYFGSGMILPATVESVREIVSGLSEARVVFEAGGARRELLESFTAIEGAAPRPGDRVRVVIHRWLPGRGYVLRGPGVRPS